MVFVSGAAGTGKSTFCRWLAYLIAAGEMPEVTPGPRNAPMASGASTQRKGRFEQADGGTVERWAERTRDVARGEDEDALARWSEES